MSTFNPTPSIEPHEKIAEGADPPSANSIDPSGDMMSRMVGGAHEAIDHLARDAAPHVQRVQDGLASANEMLHQRSDQARALGSEWSEGVNRTVRDHPLAAIATAFTLGMLLTRLMR